MDQAICERFQIDIVEYIDGTLDGERLTALEQHLRSCEACSRLVEEMRLILGEVAALAAPVPEDLHERIMERVAKERPAGRILRFPLRKLTVAAAALALLIGAGSLLGSSFGARKDAVMEADMAYTATNAKSASAYSRESAEDVVTEAYDDAAPMEVCDEESAQEESAAVTDAAPQSTVEELAFAAAYELHALNLPDVLQPYALESNQTEALLADLSVGTLLAAVPVEEVPEVLNALDADEISYTVDDTRISDPDAEMCLFILYLSKE